VQLLASCAQAACRRGNSPCTHPPCPPQHGKSQLRARFGGWLADVASFDASLFQLTSNEVEVMDPQQRLLLEVSWEALQAGPGACGPDTGVYVGIQQMEYGSMASAHTPVMGAFAATGTPFSVAAGRLSFTYGFGGPAVSIDTACSSAMVAAHSAAQHLQRRGGAALSAGVNLMLAERTTAAAQVAGMLTLNGRCKTLDAAADGYVRAEACIVLHLSVPDGASTGLRAGSILLRSTFVNQDGRSSSLTAPNGPAQQRVIRGALDAACAAPAELLGLEMHGTGTPLGDPIEVGAATAVLGGGPLPLRLTAAKSRVGHAEPAAGSVGILQVTAQLAGARGNAIMHLVRINPHVSSTFQELRACGQASPYLPRQDAPGVAAPGAEWDSSMGVSSFAFQGTNAHVLLGNAPQRGGPPAATSAGLDAALWRRQRYWYCAPLTHLLDRCTAARPGVVTVQADLGKPTLGYLKDHRVRGRALFPAAGMLELASAAAAAALQPHTVETLALGGVAISAPLVLQAQGPALAATLDLRSGAISLHTQTAGGAATQHLAGAAAALGEPTGRRKAAAAGSLQQRMFDMFMRQAAEVLGGAVPELLAAGAAASAPCPTATGQVHAATALGQSQPGGYVCHPAVLDCMTHAAAALQASQAAERGVTRIPVGIAAYAAAAARPGEAIFHCAAAYEGELPTGAAVTSFGMAAAAAPAVRLAGFQAKAISAAAAGGAVPSAPVALAPVSGAVVAAPAAVDAATATATVQKLVAAMLGAEVAPDQPLMEAGLDSLGAVELRTALNGAFSMELPATVTFDFPTVATLARFIAAEAADVADAAAAAAPAGPAAAISAAPAASAAVDAAAVERQVAAEVRRMLGADVERGQPLMEAGMDSLGAVELRTALNAAFSLDLPATTTFDYPSIASLSTFVAAEVGEQAELAAAAAAKAAAARPPPPPAAVAGTAAVAVVPRALAAAPAAPLATCIVGVSARYPTAAGPTETGHGGLAAFWSGMAHSADLPRRIPLQVGCPPPAAACLPAPGSPATRPSQNGILIVCVLSVCALQRWDIDQLYAPDASASASSMYVRLGIFLEGVDAFDPGAFRLTPAEGLAMDPQQRVLLEQTAMALQDAAPAVGSLAGGLSEAAATPPAAAASNPRISALCLLTSPLLSPPLPPPCRHQDGRVRGLHVPGAHPAAVQPGVQAHPRGGHRQRHLLPGGPPLLHLWPSRALRLHRHRLLLLPRVRPPGAQGAAGGGDGGGGGGRRQRHAAPHHHRLHLRPGRALPRGAVQDVRRFGRRLRPRRGLCGGGAGGRRGRGRRGGAAARLRRQPGRPLQRPHRAQRPLADGAGARRAGGGRHPGC
jgi:3-oxoacyl-(acyl-carrier-protein) synthase/acyl carrier protein